MGEMIEIDDSWFVRNEGGTDRTSAGGVVARREGRKILIALAHEKGLPRFVLPKGGVEEGESLEETALREIHEEAGLSEVKLHSKLGIRERYDLHKTRWITTHYFLGSTDQLDGVPADKDHHYGLTWVDLDDVPKLYWPEQQELIETFKEEIRSKISSLPA